MGADDPWYSVFDSQFWIIVGGMVCTFFSVLAKCKCSRCSFCGVVIERNVKAELEAEKLAHKAQNQAHQAQNQAHQALKRVETMQTQMGQNSSGLSSPQRNTVSFSDLEAGIPHVPEEGSAGTPISAMSRTTSDAIQL